MTTVRIAIRETPPDHKGGHTLQRSEITAEGTDYDDAFAKARAQVTDGWQVLWVKTDTADA